MRGWGVWKGGSAVRLKRKKSINLSVYLPTSIPGGPVYFFSAPSLGLGVGVGVGVAAPPVAAWPLSLVCLVERGGGGGACVDAEAAFEGLVGCLVVG